MSAEVNQREKVLEVKDLTVSFNTLAGKVQAVRGVSFDLYKGMAFRGQDFKNIVGGLA